MFVVILCFIVAVGCSNKELEENFNSVQNQLNESKAEVEILNQRIAELEKEDIENYFEVTESVVASIGEITGEYDDFLQEEKDVKGFTTTERKILMLKDLSVNNGYLKSISYLTETISDITPPDDCKDHKKLMIKALTRLTYGMLEYGKDNDRMADYFDESGDALIAAGTIKSEIITNYE